MSFDPSELEDTEERLFAIRGLARKHDVQPDDLAGFADTLRAKLECVGCRRCDQAKLRADVKAAETAMMRRRRR